MKIFFKLIVQSGIISSVLTFLFVLSATLVTIISFILNGYEILEVLKSIDLYSLFVIYIQVIPFIFIIILVPGLIRYMYMKLIK
jgi:hypothetical protein